MIDKIVPISCPVCQKGKMLLSTEGLLKGNLYACSNSDCDARIFLSNAEEKRKLENAAEGIKRIQHKFQGEAK